MKAFQLKIVIKNSKPPIWRRVLVPAGITFSQLSMILNEVMGWSGYHLFEFEFYHEKIRLTEDIEEHGDLWDEYAHLEANTTYIREYLEENDWFTYTYDFGDDWQHRVTIEKIIQDYELEYPMVVKYKGDCPPEDCGGIYGYYRNQEILSNPGHPEYEELNEWTEHVACAEPYDMEYVNDTLKNNYFYKWGKGEKRTQREFCDEIFGGQGLNATKRDKNKKQNRKTAGWHEDEMYLRKTAELLKRMSNLEEQIKFFNEQMGKINLEEILEDFTKEDLVEIAKEKGLNKISNCNKRTLIQKIVTENLRLEVMERYLACLTDKEIDVIEKYMEYAGSRDGFLPEEDEPYLEKFYSACYIGMNFDGKYIIPEDVAKTYEKTRDSQYLKDNREKISYLLCCLRTASLLYGVMPFSVLMEMLAANQKIQMTESEVREYWKQIPIEYMDSLIVGDKIYHRVAYPDDRGLQDVQGDKEFYIPTKEEILEMGVKAYLPSGKEMRCLVNFLVKRFKLPEKHAEMVGMRVQRVISGGCDMHEVYEIFDEEEVLCASKQQVEELVVQVNDLWNNTRMLLNRGYTPKEMSRLAIERKRTGTSGSNIIGFEQARKKKVYPNDPCPCGSGKKYKNCCGKKL